MDEREWCERGLRDAVLAGDETAWKTLYDNHFDGLYLYVYFRVNRRADAAEDMVQDCWTVAVRRIQTFDPRRAAFATWLRGIADNLLLNRKRREARRFRLWPWSKTRAAVREATTNQNGLAVAEAIQVVFASLPEHYRAVLEARYNDGHTVAEIAADSDQSQKAIESLLGRARRAFRKEYQRVTTPKED